MTFNEDDIRQTYRFLNHKEETEIRLIDPNKKKPTKSVFVDNEKDFFETCVQYSKEYNISAGINERITGGTTKKDVISVKTMVIDVDPKRETNTASTEEELKKSEETAGKIKEYLETEKVKSYRAMSGNGVHLWIPTPVFHVNDENRDDSEKVSQRFQNYIRKKFEDDFTRIDNLGDLPRVIKVIGTFSIKGENTPERPQRLSRWIDKPERIENREILELLKKLPKEEKQETKETEKNGKMEIILNFDKNFKKLMEGKFDDKYDSRSEKEMAVVIKLSNYGFSFEEIDGIMKLYKMEKWCESHPQYKKITFDKAQEYMKRVPKNTLQDYLDIKVQAVLIYPNSEESITKIITEHGSIELTSLTILNTQQFRSMYYILSGGTMLGMIKQEIWAKILTYWTTEYGRVINIGRNTEDEIIKERMIDEIENFIEVDEISESIFYGRVFREDGCWLVPGSSIETIIKKNKYNIKMSKVAYIMQDYLSSASKPKKVNQKLVRFWFFKEDKIQPKRKDNIEESVINE